MRRLLVANRGEIAVRVLRACKDAGLTGIAVYADQDRNSPHARLADESYSLDGTSAARTYLSIPKLLQVIRTARADAVHPGYGFLSESAEFAAAVQEAGLIWVGPDPDVIRMLGDKVAARRIAARAGAPAVPGTPGPVGSAEEAEAFAAENGLPVAIKAAHGGGGRGLKVARTLGEVRACFEAAVREAQVSFGNGECFVERYLDRARHVETQCLADRYGNVVVVSTRDCTLQRRHQKLVEEAPAPFLPPGVEERLRRSSEAILTEAGYVGAGTCEFLLGEDGTLTFLEVNTRLQVEHPVTEEVTGVDLVTEQLRIAQGANIRSLRPRVTGHSLEFRVNGEDPGRGFLPCPGTVTRWRTPSGPGVRVDAGVEEGTVVDTSFDSMLGKLVVTGRTREEALRRARRALAEFEVEGLATVLPFHREIVSHPAFTAAEGSGLRTHTAWVETEFDNRIPPAEHGPVPGTVAQERYVGVVEIGSRRVEVSLPGEWSPGTPPLGPRTRGRPSRRPRARARAEAAPADVPSLTSPMQGSVLSICVTEGQSVTAGEPIAVLEAMKMEHSVKAHLDGTVTTLPIQVGASVAAGDLICEIRA